MTDLPPHAFTLSDCPLQAISLRLIDLIAKGVAATVVQQLRQADRILDQAANDYRNILLPSRHERQLLLDRVLMVHFERLSVYWLGIRKAIFIDIRSIPELASLYEPGVPIPGNETLVPYRLIQDFQSGAIILKEASKEFVSHLTPTVHSVVDKDVKENGENLHKVFSRLQRLHRDKHGMAVDEQCCIFRLLEEHFEAADGLAGLDKRKSIGFTFVCAKCKHRHYMNVWK